MSWLYLLIAILFEVSGTTSMKLSDGFRNLVPSICIFVFYGSSIFFLTLAVRSIDISVAYAIWCALGTTLIATIGVLYFGETMNALRLLFIALILVGVVGLRATSR